MKYILIILICLNIGITFACWHDVHVNAENIRIVNRKIDRVIELNENIDWHTSELIGWENVR